MRFATDNAIFSIVDSLRNLHKVVAGLFIAIIAVSVLSIVVGSWQVTFLGGAPSDVDSEATEELIDSLETVVGWFQFGLSIACGILFLMWLHQAHLNLTLGRLRDLTYTPGRAVAGFFIPLLNLVRPFRALKEVWSGSAYLASGDPARSWKETAPSPIVAWWWLMFLASSALGRMYGFRLRHVRGVDELISVTKLGILSDGLDIVAAVLAMALVAGVTDLQEQARARLESPIHR